MFDKTKKIIRRTLLIIVILLVVLIVGGIFFLDSVVKHSIQTVAPIIVGVPVTVESVSISLLEGRVEVKDFIVANPKGYDSPYAVKLGDIAVDVDLATVLKEKIVIEEIRLKDIMVNFESNIISTNLLDIKKNVDNLAKKEKQQAEAESKEEPAQVEQPEVPEVKEPEKAESEAQKSEAEETEELQKAQKVKIQINKLIYKNVGVCAVVKGLGANNSLPVAVSLPEMGPLGEGEEGVTVTEVISEICTKTIQPLLDAGNAGLKNVASGAQDAMKQGNEALKSSSQQVQSTMNDVSTSVKETSDSVKKSGEEIKKSGEEIKKSVNDLKDTFQKIF